MSSATITSFSIGALLLLAIVGIESRIMTNSEGVTLDQMNKEHLAAVTQIVSNDVRKIGYGVNGNGIVTYEPNEISFKCDLYNKGNINQITWKFDKTATISSNQNPNVGLLTRTVDGNKTQIPYGVTRFQIVMLDSLGHQTTSTANAKQIQIKIDCQSPVKSNGNYFTSTWQHTFTPTNLKLKK
ncbi:MAG TPA: hypothetical protein VKA34_14730 [Balneolales bacterium]|nr:hypothetical protein [Balneolales bacterium]